MTINDPLANALSKILNSERQGKPTCVLFPASGMIKNVLGVLQDHHYLGAYQETNDSKANYVDVALIGRINKCGSVKPRFAVKANEYAKFEKRYLLAKGFGILIVSTPKGIMTHTQAKEQHVGGRLLAYCY